MSFGDLMILLLIWIPLIALAVFALADLHRRSDLSGISIGLWAIAIVLLPIVGMLIYFGVRPDQQATPVRAPGVPPGQADIDDVALAKLERIGHLREAGVITDDELTAMKIQILA